jgi:hypothetical protein
MRQSKLIWKDGRKSARASFSIPLVGELNIEVESQLPGAGSMQSEAERKALALRHARLLVRNLANELDGRWA